MNTHRMDPVSRWTSRKNDSPFYESQFSSDAPVSGLAKRNVMPGAQNIRVHRKDKKANPTWIPGGGVQQ